MPAALTIAAHHIRRVMKNPGLILLLLAIPLTLAVIEYAAFGRTAAAGKLPPATVLFLDEDDTLVSGALPQVFSGGPAKDFFELSQVPDKAEAARLFTRGQAAALIVVPKGFQDAVLEGTRAELGFYPNPVQSIGPEIARSMIEMTALIGNGLYAKALEPVSQIGRSCSRIASRRQTRWPRSPAASSRRAAAWRACRAERADGGREAPGGLRREDGIRQRPGPVLRVRLPGAGGVRPAVHRAGAGHAPDARSAEGPPAPPRHHTGRTERRHPGRGDLHGRRALRAADRPGLIGAVVFRIQLRDPASLVAIGAGFAIFASGLHLLSMALAKSDRGAGFVGSVVVLVLSLVGGTFVPAEQYPPFLRSLAMLVPNGAAQQGFIDVLVHHAPLSALGGRLAVVWAWGLGVMALAVYFDQRRLRS